MTKTGWPGRSSRGRGSRDRAALPQLRDRPCLADQHSRRRARDLARERTAPVARRDDVDAHVAQREQLATVDARDETPEPAPRDVLEEDPLDGILARRSRSICSRFGSMSFAPTRQTLRERGSARAPNRNP